MRLSKIPATVVAGFLGRGKTTLLASILRQVTGKHIAEPGNIRMAIIARRQEPEPQGVAPGAAAREASYRVFGSKPGEYGTGLNHGSSLTALGAVRTTWRPCRICFSRSTRPGRPGHDI